MNDLTDGLCYEGSVDKPRFLLCCIQRDPGCSPSYNPLYSPRLIPRLFTLDFPSYYPVLTHGKNRALREEMYKAYMARASSGEVDNTPIIDKV